MSKLIHSKSTSPTVVEIVCYLERPEKAAIVMRHYPSSVSEALACGNRPDVLLANIALHGLATCQAFVLAKHSHGDLKPGNMMMSATGGIVCIDLETCAAFGKEITGFTPGYSNTLDSFQANPLLDMHLLAGVFMNIAVPKLLESADGKEHALAALEELEDSSSTSLAVGLAKVLLRSKSVEDARDAVWELVKEIPDVVDRDSIWPTPTARSESESDP